MQVLFRWRAAVQDQEPYPITSKERMYVHMLLDSAIFILQKHSIVACQPGHHNCLHE